MRKTILTGLVGTLGILFAIPGIAQKFYSLAEDSAFPNFGQEIGVFELDNCTNRVICADVSGISSTLIPWNNIFYLQRSNQIWEIFDTTNCQHTGSRIFVPIPPVFDISQGLTVVDSSRFYVSGRDSFYRYKPLTNTYETISENIPSMKTKGWMFIQIIKIDSDYYGINSGHEIWRIDTNYLPNSTRIIDLYDIFSSDRHILSHTLTKVQTVCDSFRLITIIHDKHSNLQKSYFYELSWPDFDTTLICINEDQGVKGLLAIDDQAPYDNCELVVDLDQDNSTGLEPIDYRSRYVCTSETIPILDRDAYLYTRTGYDSMVLQLTGILNAGQEYLSTPPTTDFVIDGTNSPNVVIYNTNDRPIRDLSQYLQQVEYINTAIVPDAGMRTVTFDLYEEGFQAPTATAYIDLQPHTERAGLGDTLYLCEGSAEIDLFEQLHPSASPMGHWLDPMGLAIDGRIDADPGYAGVYAYVVERQPCIPDTAWFEVNIFPIPRFSLGNDTAVCSGTQLTLELPVIPGATFIWDDGFPDQMRIIDSPGQYSANSFLAMPDGRLCVYADTVNIRFLASSDTSRIDTSICEGGSIRFMGSDIDLPGTFTFSISGASGCDSIVQLRVDVQDVPAPAIQRKGAICHGQPVDFSIAQSYDSIRWSTGQTGSSITATTEGLYSVTAFKNGCMVRDSVELEWSEPISAIFSLSDITCPGKSDGAVYIDAVQGGSGPYRVALNGKNIDPDRPVENLSAGRYTLVVTDAMGCSREETFELEVLSELLIFTKTSITAEYGDSVYIALEVLSGDVDRVEWDTDLPLTLLDPLRGRLLAVQDRVVRILVTDVLGCTVLLEVTIRINRVGVLFVPNAFTPNGDGVNDVFLPTGKNPLLPVRRFAVFDRWGNQVHEESDKLLGELRGWDGTTGGRLLSPAVFVVVVEYTGPDGSLQRETGDVTLVR